MATAKGGRAPLARLLLVLPYAAAALGVALFALADAASAPTARLVDSFDDDAYYYFEVARHLVEGQGSSFDGLLQTNGYHPLWLLVLLPVFALVAGKVPALLAVKVLCSALFVATVAILERYGRRLGRELEIACALPILVFCRELWLSGMETALLLPLLVLASCQVLAEGLLVRAEARSFGCSLVLALALLARLDLVFFVALLALAAFFLLPQPNLLARLRRSILLGLPAAAALLAYMGVSLLLFGTASPVSGQAKALGGPFWSPRVFQDYLAAKPVLGPIFELLPVGALLPTLLLPALLAGLLLSRRPAAPPELRGAALLLGVVLAANLTQLVYYATFSSWPLWRWYYYYLPLALVVAIALGAGLLLPRLPPRLRQALPLLLAAGLAAKLGSAYLHQRQKNPAPSANYKIQAWAAAEALNRQLPADAILAMGDRAGAFGYFLDRPLVQVEGLVASKAFLLALEKGEVHPLLARLGVDYVIYSGGPKSGGDPQPLEGQPGCASFEEPKWGRGPKYRTEVCEQDLVYRQILDHPGAMGGTTSVWLYRPELNPR